MKNPYNFRDFIEEIKEYDYFEIIRVAENRCRSIEESSFSKKGAIQRRALGSVEFTEKLKKFLYFLRYNAIPAGIEDYDLLELKKIASKLVKKKQLKNRILNLFK